MEKVVPPNTWKEKIKSCDSTNAITISTFNTLRRNYTYRTKYWVSEKAKEWDFRRNLLYSIFNSLEADIFCLQEAEISTFEEDFGQFFTDIGYKVLSPTVQNSQHDFTKPSIAYNPDKLDLVMSNPRSRVMIAGFKFKSTGQFFFVANCHLQGGPKPEDQRFFQLRSTLKIITQYITEKKLKAVPCFICGDLNSNPGDVGPLLLEQGQLTDEQITKVFGENKKDTFKFSHSLKFSDTYDIENRPFTFKYGVDNDAVREMLDYIFYTPDTVEVEWLRDTMTEEERKTEKEWGLPNLTQPSDHFPVAARFLFVNKS